MKILAVHNRYQQPGGEDVVYEAETALLERAGHDVVRYERHNDDVEAMGRIDLLRRTISNPRTERDLDSLIAQERPDVMHCHNIFPLVSPAAYRAARRHGVAVVQTLHNYRLVCPDAGLMREGRVCEDCLGKRLAWPGIARGCYRSSHAGTAAVAGMAAWHRVRGTWTNAIDRYATPTAFVRTKFIEAGFPADRIEAKLNFVSGDPPIGRGRGGYAVFVGRLSPEKGVDVLLEAWRRLSGDHGLKIVGDGPLAPMVRAAAEADPRIEWLGHLPRSQVLATLGAARVLVMPSVWYETFGLCIAEAFATGTPALVSDLGAMAELVDDRTGVRVAPGDPDTLVQALDAPFETMRSAARAAYEERFSETVALEALLGLYRRALETAAAGHVHEPLSLTKPKAQTG